jgi:lactate permease
MNKMGLITLTGIAAGIGVMLIMLLYLFIIRKPIHDRNKMDENDLAAEKRMALFASISPWVILIVISLFINAPYLPFFDLTFTRFSMPLEIIPGSPEKIRLLWQAYFWIAISTLISLPIMKTSSTQLKISIKKWLRRAPRPVFSAAIFCVAYLFNHSGKDTPAVHLMII